MLKLGRRLAAGANPVVDHGVFCVRPLAERVAEAALLRVVVKVSFWPPARRKILAGFDQDGL